MKTLEFKKYLPAGFIIFCSIFIPSKIQAQANVYITPSSLVLSGQSTFTVDVMIANVLDLHDYSLKIVFDNSIIHFHSAQEGPFLASGGNTFFFTTSLPTANYIIVDDAILGTATTNGSGKLFSVTFDVLSAGNSTINVASIQLKDHDITSIPVSWTSGGVIVPLSMNTKIFLQGPFNVNNMYTTLNLAGYLPLTQPYSSTPWNYTGTESVSSGFYNIHTNIVDWILVELRTGLNGNTLVERKAGFLTNLGQIVGLDGLLPLYFSRSKGNYYVVIYHRNHIPIMTSNSTSLDYVSVQYDFTTAQSKAYGTNAMVSLGGGIWGMIAADANGNGQVQNNDSEDYWEQQNGQSGYKEGDFNLNGQVQNNDHEAFWVPNNGKGTQVPN